MKKVTSTISSFGVKLALLGLAALVILTSTNASLFAAGDERFVSLYLDGQTQNVITEAETVEQVLDELEVEIHQTDVVEPELDTKLEGVGYQVNVYRSRPVRVVYDDQVVDIRSASYSPAVIAEQAGFEVYPEDEYVFEPVTELVDDSFVGDQVVVDRAAAVTLEFDGYSIEVRSQAETVGQLLEEFGLELEGQDISVPKADKLLKDGTKVTVIRVGKDVVTKEETIKAETIYETDYTKPTSYREVTTAGRDGQVVRSYRVIKHNGEVVERELISETVIEKVRDEVVTVGGAGTLTPTVTGSKADWLNASNIPASDHGFADAIISRESGWSYTVWNHGGSGAYGLCQSLPASKMASAGSDYMTNPVTQLNWCHSYAVGRYGGWANAYAAWQRQHWW